MPMSQGNKVVQIELSNSEYEALAQTAKSLKLTIKQAVKEALKEWTVAKCDLSSDPLFSIRPAKFRVKIRADRLDEYLYLHKK